MQKCLSALIAAPSRLDHLWPRASPYCPLVRLRTLAVLRVPFEEHVDFVAAVSVTEALCLFSGVPEPPNYPLSPRIVVFGT